MNHERYSLQAYCLKFQIFLPLIIFCLILTTKTARNENLDPFAGLKVSNIPCGNSFIPCEDDELFFDASTLESKKSAVSFGVKTSSSQNLKASELPQNDELESFSNSKKAQMVREISKLLGDKGLQNAAIVAKSEIDQLFNSTENRLFRDFKATNFLFSTMAWNELWRSDRHIKTLSYSALASTAATRFLSNNSLINVDQVRVGLADMSLQKTVLEQHCPTNGISECVPGKYRSYSGHCNNVREPLWGAAYEPLKRLKPAVYSDGIEKPRQLSNSQGNPPLPSPRLISNKLLNGSTASTKSQKHSCSLLLAQWAQFIYEDIARIGTNRIFSSESSRNSASIPMPCCAEQHPECLPIITDTDDLPYRARGQCLPYARSMAAPRLNCSLGPREQANLVSSFIDGSHIYGSNEDETSTLRTFSNGLMKTNPQPSRQDLLPPDLDNIVCQSTSSFRPCFLSASRMTNLLPTAAALHTIWVRQHNRLARNLKKTNPGTLNEYASSAGLFFFSLFPGTLGFTDSKGEISQQRTIGNLFNDPSSIYQKGRLEGIIRTLLHEPITRLNTPYIDVEFRDKFMRGPDKYGVDLAAMIIQMGRDHGLDSFTSWRKLCGLSRPTSFTELPDIFLPESPFVEFKSIYLHVDDIDLFVGGLAERPLPGAFLGPTFSCIIERQFERLRHGDRFWYENFFEPSAFTLKQLSTIRESTMAGVICDNTDDIGMIQPNVFQQADNYLCVNFSLTIQ
uniref:Peroxidase n=1 Tax=Meloidogyne floridensis TaxID=298350 RepID=A0A915P484_9BILA